VFMQSDTRKPNTAVCSLSKILLQHLKTQKKYKNVNLILCRITQ